MEYSTFEVVLLRVPAAREPTREVFLLPALCLVMLGTQIQNAQCTEETAECRQPQRPTPCTLEFGYKESGRNASDRRSALKIGYQGSVSMHT